jgi:hypothetical protein
MQQSIYNVNASQAGSSHVLFMLELIETLKFVHDYRIRSQGKGGKKWATAFRRAQFQVVSTVSAEFVGLDTEQKNVLMEDAVMKEIYEDWQRKNEVDVTSMNRVYEIYHKVSVVIIVVRQYPDHTLSLVLVSYWTLCGDLSRDTPTTLAP